MKTPIFSVTLKDLKIDWFSGSGAGGQHRNKHQNCCRLTHPATGVTVTAQDSRSRQTNQRKAFDRLCAHPRFRAWLRRQTLERMGQVRPIEDIVEEQMDPRNIKTEVYRNSSWIELD